MSLSPISELRSLTYLDLSCINFTGSQIGLLTQLSYLNLSSCSFRGIVSRDIFSNASKLNRLDLFFNDRLNLSFPSNWTPPFRLSHILLRSTRLGPEFPNWLRTQYLYSVIDISGSVVSATAVFVDLSQNKITGGIITGDRPVALSLVTAAVELRSNHLEGSVPSFLFQTRFVDLSRNNFTSLDLPCVGVGAAGFSILSFLDASENQLPGGLPDCWSYFVSLRILSLLNNNLSGNIPPSIGSLDNNFIGEILSTLKSCTELLAIDFGGNRFSGSVPAWLGTSPSSLASLALSVIRRVSKSWTCRPTPSPELFPNALATSRQ